MMKFTTDIGVSYILQSLHSLFIERPLEKVKLSERYRIKIRHIQMFNILRIRCLESFDFTNEICLGLGPDRWGPLRLFGINLPSFHS